MQIESLSEMTYFGSSLLQYVTFFAILTAGAVVGRALSFAYERRLKKRTAATGTEVDDIVARSLGGPISLLGVVVAAALGRQVLTPTPAAEETLVVAGEILLIVSLAWVAVRLTDGLVETYIGRYADRTESKLDDALVPIVSRMTNVAIVSIGVIVILDSVGYDVTAVIASLGIGGIAVALAARKTLSDVFGGAHILSTKPFLVDDVIEMGDYAGTVEEIGLRSTTIRDFDGRLVTIPNSNVAETEVRNISSEQTHRTVYELRLPYRTDTARMDRVLELLETTVDGIDGVATEKTRVHFWEYDESAMKVRLEYHIADMDRWQAVKDAVNRAIHREFEAAGLEMALPMQSIRVTGETDHREA